MKIYLIGMPGSGKSTLGRPLANKLNLPFVDQDKEIESREGKSVQEIFAAKGEDYFRQLESQVLRDWAGSDKSFVLATGGGAPCFLGGIDVINESGLSIFLDVPIHELLKRVAGNKERPLLHAEDIKEQEARLITLHQNRLTCYQKAHIVLARPTTTKILEAIQLRS